MSQQMIHYVLNGVQFDIMWMHSVLNRADSGFII